MKAGLTSQHAGVTSEHAGLECSLVPPSCTAGNAHLFYQSNRNYMYDLYGAEMTEE